MHFKPTNFIREIKINIPRDQRVMWPYGMKLRIVCSHPARFGGHRYCSSGDKNPMWPCVQRIVWLNGLMFLIVSHYLTKFSGHRPCGSSSNTTAKILQVALQNHVIKGSGDFMKEKSLLHFPALPKLIAIDILLVNIYFL